MQEKPSTYGNNIGIMKVHRSVDEEARTLITSQVPMKKHKTKKKAASKNMHAHK
jgi:hypothetical protein